jgi:hypothetical protein
VFQGDWELTKFKESGIREVREPGRVSIREPQLAVIFIDKSFGGQEEESKMSLQKFEFKMLTSDKLVNV